MFDIRNRFIIENYQRKSAFASFLPGVAGETGIPIWCFYVNRGQAVCSFGTGDKEHPIMEFSPAHVAYHEVTQKGFRTFARIDGVYFEPFRATTEDTTSMHIGMNELLLEQTSEKHGLKFKVRYFALPNERVGALMREVTVENVGTESVSLELLDGMPAVITYGTTSNIMKVMTQTHKAWMQVEDVEKRTPYYRLRASSEDTAQVVEIKQGHFAFAFDENGSLLPVIADPNVVFEYNLSLDEATGLRHNPLCELLKKDQIVSNEVPTAFFAAERTLAPGEAITLREAYGMAANKDVLAGIVERLGKAGAFDERHAEAVALTESITDMIATRTGDPVFDAYCRQTCLDNLLRGGYPLELGGKVFYLYSRKHGDIERDYNFYQMLPEYYSQGNANFRDVNQNRRSDPLFAPHVGDFNIKLFMDLIQLDGNNPLVIERASFTLEPSAVEKVTALVEGDTSDLAALLSKPYTPGALATLLDGKICKVAPREVLETAIANSTPDVNVTFGEGYWTDHWTYNLDLIESYLAVFPEREEELLFDDGDYRFYESHAVVNPRSMRYTVTENGVRQYNALTEREAERQWVGVRHGKGEDYRTNLAAKLIVLAMNKVAALDPFGMGVEMEGGRPGWYDALNGLPGLLGSSMAESCEVVRLIDYTIGAFRRADRSVKLPRECAEFIAELAKDIDLLSSGKLDRIGYWNAVNTYKEAYRAATADGIDGDEVTFSARAAIETLELWKNLVLDGVERARGYAELPPCYFSYEVSDYDLVDGAVVPKAFAESPLPTFLEGVVRYMKMPGAGLKPAELHERVMASPLYDSALRMFKVNTSLADSSFELGRCRAFTPGWLENESIWLHMEYKYLLGLLRSGLYSEFFAAFKDAGIPFQNPEIYGRSPLENSSFIASSANPNPSIRGKGFVARLSGSTAEFMQIWQIMMFGEKPFTFENGELTFAPQPAIPAYLASESGIDCKLLGKTDVHYAAAGELIPGSYTVGDIRVEWSDGSAETFGGKVCGVSAERIRSGEAVRIEIAF